MSALARLAAAVVVALSVTFAAPAQADDGPACDVVGDATCQPATCEDDAVYYRARVAQLERQLQRVERRIERKNATIKRLRAVLAQS
jgi:TolA-binding protein